MDDSRQTLRDDKLRKSWFEGHNAGQELRVGHILRFRVGMICEMYGCGCGRGGRERRKCSRGE